MDEVEVTVVAEPDLRDPVLVEGLPGVGHVGKLAVEHLVEEHESQQVAVVYSEHFPPQVTVDEAGVADLARAEIYAVETEDRDLLVLVGDYQSQDPIGHYRLTERFLDIAGDFGAEEIYALGGVPTGELVDEYTVLGAVSDANLIEDLEEAGVEFRPNEPAGGIVGTSGLLLGLGRRRGVPAMCLMGETSGYLVDPKSAQAVLEVLETVIGFEVDYGTLEERAEEMEEVVRQLREMETETGGGGQPTPSDEDLRYIG
ncbi:MAG: proteasome assembly chaperone family protein [Halobacteriales archaeon]|nr:proteasome assembly chaperone family protein [Halobacteriales archaeon]